jgi:hypothetical protein
MFKLGVCDDEFLAWAPQRQSATFEISPLRIACGRR